MSTVQAIQKRLQDRRGEWPEIARTAGLSYWWVMKIAQGKIAEPGLRKVEKLVAELDARDRGIATPAANEAMGQGA